MIDGLCKKLTVDNLSNDQAQALRTWLQEQAQSYGLTHLLAHADDGVIWGRFDNQGTLTTAEQVFSQFPRLHTKTLQQCRAFGEKAEVLLWRSDQGWRSRLIQHQEGVELIETLPWASLMRVCTLSGEDVELIEEKPLLWGTEIKKQKDGFTLLSDGQQGLEHAVPLAVSAAVFNNEEPKKKRPVLLVVHHYINYDNETGIARICLSRLVSVVVDQDSAQ